MKSLILLFLSLSITKIYAQVPNQFSSGDSVSAEKINENFSYASKRLVLKNNGTFIGDIMCNENSCSLITTKGYLVPNLINIFETSETFNISDILSSFIGFLLEKYIPMDDIAVDLPLLRQAPSVYTINLSLIILVILDLNSSFFKFERNIIYNYKQYNKQ